MGFSQELQLSFKKTPDGIEFEDGCIYLNHEIQKLQIVKICHADNYKTHLEAIHLLKQMLDLNITENSRNVGNSLGQSKVIIPLQPLKRDSISIKVNKIK